MKNILRKGHHGVVAQFNVIHAIESSHVNIHPDLQKVLSYHQQVFEKPKELAPSRGEHDHSIPFDSCYHYKKQETCVKFSTKF